MTINYFAPAGVNIKSILGNFLGGNVNANCIVTKGDYAYFGGAFTSYLNPNGKSVSCIGVAKINLNTLYFDPLFDASLGAGIGTTNLNAIAVDDNNGLFVAGNFSTWKGQTRLRLAKLDATTGALDNTFDTSNGFSSFPTCMLFDGNGGLILGGSFSTYRGTSVKYLVKLNTTNGDIISQFDTATGADSGINGMAIDGNGNLFISGAFTSYKGTTRQRIAKINATTAALDTTFNTASGFTTTIGMLLLDGNGSLFACGTFSSYKTITRQNLVKIDATTGAIDTTFDTSSGFDNTVTKVFLDGSGSLYVGGNFLNYKGLSRPYLAKINATTAAIDTSFDTLSGMESGVVEIAKGIGDNLFIGGGNGSYKTEFYGRLVSINKNTASPSDQQKINRFNGIVYKVIKVGNYIYAVGSFTKYVNPNGSTSNCQRVAKINLLTGMLDTTFDTSSGADNTVNDVFLDSGGNLIIGGTFQNYKGTARQRIAKINATTGALDTTFDTSSGANGDVNAIIGADTGNLFVAGGFSTYKTVSRRSVMKINATTGALDTTFDTTSGSNSALFALAYDGNNGLYIGGGITQWKSVTNRQYVIKVNATTAELDATFDTASGASALVYSLALDGNGSLYIGGNFQQYKTVARQRIAKINATTAALDTTFDSSTGVDNTVFSIVLNGSGDLFLGGVFTTCKGIGRQRLAKIDATTSALNTEFDTTEGHDGVVRSILLDNANIFVGGGFNTYKGYVHGGITLVNASNAQNLGW